MNTVKLRNINQHSDLWCFCTLTTNYPKKKLRKQYLYNRIKKNTIFGNKFNRVTIDLRKESCGTLIKVVENTNEWEGIVMAQGINTVKTINTQGHLKRRQGEKRGSDCRDGYSQRIWLLSCWLHLT